MTGQSGTEDRGLSVLSRFAGGAICILIVLLLLTGASTIPFTYESPSILYKLGIDKTFLRTGKVFGMLAATLLLMQLPLVAGFKMLDRIFTMKRLYMIHRINAVVIAMLALSHPLLVFAPEDINSIPVELHYWSEALGAFLLVLIWLTAATAIWRQFLDFSYDRWRLFHRVATLAAVVMLIFHVLFVSETFASGRPRLIVYAAGGIYAAVFGYVKMKRLFLKKTG